MRSFARQVQNIRGGERGESLIETIAALLILSLFVLAAMAAFQSTLVQANTQRRLAELDSALTQAKAKIEADPYDPAGAYVAPTVPQVTFTLTTSQLTARLQEITIIASFGATRQATLFKTPMDFSGATAGGAGGPGGAALGAPKITSTAPTSGLVRQAFSYQAQATGASPLTWSLLTGPAGLAIDPSTGLVTWTPDSFGTFGVAIEVQNGFGSDRQSFTIAVSAAPTITTSPVTTGYAGIAYSYQARAQGTTPITWSLTVLPLPPTVLPPVGMTVDANQGLVTWAAPVAGSYAVSLKATNAVGSATQTYTLLVVTPVTLTVALTDGFDSEKGKTLVQEGKLADVQTSDGKRLDIKPPFFVSFQFQQAVPSTARVLSVKIRVQHYEEKGVGQGLIVWDVGGGALTAPTVFGSFAPTVLIDVSNEAFVDWDVTAVIDTPEKANGLKFVVRNDNDQNSRTFLNLVQAIVVYAP